MNVLRAKLPQSHLPVPWKKFVAEYPDMADELEVNGKQKPCQTMAGWCTKLFHSHCRQIRYAAVQLAYHRTGQKMLEKLPISHFEPANDELIARSMIFSKSFQNSTTDRILN